jgi:arsenite/tail-anchored protein-transporting ATPase
MRFILFTGKGGVGKTTIAAATAIECSKQGKKTLLISTDPAHSLSDAFNMQLSPEPELIQDNLWCMEFDVYYSMKKYWSNMKELMFSVFKFKGLKNVVAEELSVLPGMEEGAAFLWLEKFYQEKFFDVVVIDSAPTGETLTLLSLPQATKSWMTKAFPGQKFAIKTVGKVIRKTTGIPLDKGYDEIQSLFSKFEIIQKVFLDSNTTSIRIVCNPEKMVIQEAKRSLSYLQLYGYNVDALIINRIYPKNANMFFKDYLIKQKQYIKDVEEDFSPIPIFKSLHQGKEVFGIKSIEKVGNEIYSNEQRKAYDVFYQDKAIDVKTINNGYKVSMKIPFIKENEFTLKKFGDELIIDINNQRKSLFLPKFSNYMKIEKFSYDNPWLIINLIKD